MTLLAWLLWPRPTLAHAVLLASYPGDGSVVTAPPTSIHLWFSGPVELSGSAIVVTSPSGRQVVRGPIHNGGIEVSGVIAATETGTYLVRWSVISVDTYPSSGSFIFSVGRPGGVFAGTVQTGSAGPPLGLVLQVSARWLHFVGYALGFGPLAFLTVVLRPTPPMSSSAATRRLWRLVTAGVAALLLAEPLALLAQMISLGTGTAAAPDLLTSVLASSFGRVLAQRLGAAVLLWGLIGPAKAGAERLLPALMALGAGLALVDGEASHATSGSLPVLGLGLNTIHLAAMAVWVGGLAALLAVWGGAEPAARSAVRARFGRLAAVCVALLTASGALMAWLQLTRLDDVVTTAYGRALTAKTLLVCAILLLASLAARARGARRFRWWGLEGAALLAVLALAGMLVSLPPPR